MRLRPAPSPDDRATELLAAIAQDAEAVGVEAVPSGDGPSAPGDVSLFVPSPGRGMPAGVDPRSAIAICADSPGGGAFDVATAIAARTAGALALSEAAAVEQRRRGVASEWLQLGLSARWRTSGGLPPSKRERDAVFVGMHSARRERLLARNAPSLAALRAEVRLGSPWPGSRPLPVGAPRRELLASSALVLDLRPGAALGGLDRVLALEAIGAGAVPLFEHVLDSGPLTVGVHMEVADGAHLGLAARALLREPERLDRMAADAREHALAELSPRPAIERLLALAESVAARSRRGARRPGPRGDAPPPRRSLSGDRRPSNGNGHDAAERKRAVLGALERRGHLRAGLLRADGLDGELRCVYESPAWKRAPARGVAVCVPVHDDGELAVEALASAAGSAGAGVELLVADDASGDDSRARVEAWLHERPHLPARLLASAVNRGVGAARNAMLANASAPAAFMLDADNLLFPDGLARLAGALGAAPRAMFAYGLIERHREGQSVGLLSAGPWEPDRLRHGNYIDAMALLHRERVLGLGGFAEDRRLYGWEDFDLWCRVAEAGGEGAFVPEFIGRYREREGSMLSVAEIDATDAIALLGERAPTFAPDALGVPGAAP